MILLVMVVTVGIHKNQFYIEKEYSASNSMPVDKNGETMDPEEISLIGNQEIRQKFIARESEITKVMIDFKAWEQKNGTGIIEVDLEDQNGNVLASAKKK